MYPNPQDALPLPPRPSDEHYRKLAKDLVRASAADRSTAVREWAHRWLRSLAALDRGYVGFSSEPAIERLAQDLERFARETLSQRDRSTSTGALAKAHLVIARAHGFPSWPVFVDHIESLARARSPVSGFEAAAEAIVGGDISTLGRLLREHPELIRARSTREHRATLLHYVSANGIENYRQISPTNIAQIADLLLAA